MIVLSLLLVIAAAVLLVLGLFNSAGLGLIYGSIGACVAAIVLLTIGVLQRRRAGQPSAPEDGGYGPGAAPAGDAPVVRPDAESDEAATIVTGGGADDAHDGSEGTGEGSEVVAAGPEVGGGTTTATSPTTGGADQPGDDEAAEVVPKTTAGEAAGAAVGAAEPSIEREPAPEPAVTGTSAAGPDQAGGDDEEILAGVSGIGPAKQDALLQRFDSVDEIRDASVDELTDVKGFGESLARSVKEQLAGDAADREALEDLRGVGPAKQDALLDEFGSVEAIRDASVVDIADVDGFGNRLAQSVKTQLDGGRPRAATTGAEAEEVLAGVKGIGPSKGRALLDRFGSVEAIRDASVDELVEVKGFGESLAASVKEQLS